jgi:ribosomal protein S18 acetylase RimI-like enzyme
MELTEQLSFDNDDRKDIYEYVERHGNVREQEARRALNLDPAAFGHHVTILKRDGYLRGEDGHLEVAYGDEQATEHESDGVNFGIRVARQNDLSGLLGTIRQVAEEGSYIEAETVADMIDHEEVILRHNELGSRLFFVATIGEDVVGWVHLELPEAEKLSHTAVLTVGLLEEYRNHGIGSALLERGTEWAEEHGFEKLYNSVPSVNDAAIAFLESHGWETEAVREDHYKINGDYVDEVMMAVRIG